MANAPEKCGERAAPLVPRWGWWFACVLPKGHEGEHKQGGSCNIHGPYVGERCPHWPDCAELAIEQQSGKLVEKRRR